MVMSVYLTLRCTRQARSQDFSWGGGLCLGSEDPNL